MNVGSELWYAPKQQHDTLEPPIIVVLSLLNEHALYRNTCWVNPT